MNLRKVLTKLEINLLVARRLEPPVACRINVAPHGTWCKVTATQVCPAPWGNNC